MATANLPFVPLLTSNASGLFGTSSLGYVQGVALPDATSRNQLRSGTVSSGETLTMYGGIGIYDYVPAAGSDEQGCIIGRATSVAAQAAKQLTGFTVFNQGTAYLNTPSSPVPSVGTYGSMSYYRIGGSAGVRIPLACAPALAASLDGGISTALVSWDFNAQQLIPYVAAYNANVLTAATWASTSGGQVTFTTTSAHGVTVGSYFTISGMTPSGYNGDFIAITGTTGSTLVAALATNPGSETVLGTLVAGGGAVPLKGIDSITTNGKTVIQNASGGWSWATGQTIALVQL